MNITTTAGPVTVLAVTGDLDASTFSQLTAEADRQLAAGHNRLVLDLSEVNYVSSAGLVAFQTISGRALAQGGKVVLCGVNPRVMRVLNLAGFDQILTLLPNRPSAVVSLEKESEK